MERPLKRLDLLRHELKALRFMLENFHDGKLSAEQAPRREDFQSAQARTLYDAITGARSREAAEQRLGELELEDVDIQSFLRLSGEHYYSYPALVKQRAEAIRQGKLRVEDS